MDSNAAKQQVVDRLKQATNVLITVRSNPSVDQLAACIGLTLMLNKLGKHGTAVFSGQVPSTIEFLKPEATLEKNTDSLRDFIIALDKSKADKLRYKVEDKVVKIFITPYKTSISDKDLEFSQGDFNIDAVVTLGVHRQQDLDQAITSHGRILHDATVIGINNTAQANSLGNLSWIDTSASSLSELVALLDGQLGKSVLDAQISTSLLTGIVAETNRFSNKKTTSQTMTISAKLMSAGANQQLVATKLEPPTLPLASAPPKPALPAARPPAPTAQPTTVAQPKSDDGTLKINHDDKLPLIDINSKPEEPEEPQIHIDEEGTLHRADEPAAAPQIQPPAGPSNVTGGTPIMTKPPTWDNKLTANSQPDSFDQGQESTNDPLSLPSVEPPLLSRLDEPSDSSTPQSVAPHLDDARNAVAVAAASSTEPLKPRIDLNAQPVFDNLNPATLTPAPAVPVEPPALGPAHAGGIAEDPLAPDAASTLNMPTPPVQAGQFNEPATSGFDEDTPSGAPSNPNALEQGDNPPPVPPPMTPVF